VESRKKFRTAGYTTEGRDKVVFRNKIKKPIQVAGGIRRAEGKGGEGKEKLSSY